MLLLLLLLHLPLLLLLLLLLSSCCLVRIVHKVTTWPIGTKANTVKSATIFGFILGMTLQIAQLVITMGKLTLFTVFTLASLLVRTTQLRLVAGRNEREKKNINNM